MHHNRSDHGTTPLVLVYLRALLTARVVPVDAGTHAIRLGSGEIWTVHTHVPVLYSQLRGAQRAARELAEMLGAGQLDALELDVRTSGSSASPAAELRRVAAEGASQLVRAVAERTTVDVDPPDRPDYCVGCGAHATGLDNVGRPCCVDCYRGAR